MKLKININIRYSNQSFDFIWLVQKILKEW